jgi:iron complex outermembrane receptor protein
MKPLFIRKNLATAIMLASGLVATHAQAQLEEVIVTAQKREQSLQDIPIAITAFDKNAIDARGISTVRDLSLFAPNVQIVASPAGTSGATIAMRGSATINPAITWEPVVGMYLDGVFLGKNLGGVFDVAELERVEILRGPQGTLYGKNTVGGAINMITRKPADEMGGEFNVSVGNEGYTRAKLRLETGGLGTIGEGMGRFSANAAYLKAERDGFYDNKYQDPTGGNNPFVNPVSSKEFNDLDSEVWRIDTMLEVSDTFTLRYAYDHSERDQQPSMGQLTDVNNALFESQGLGFLADLMELYDTSEGDRASKISNDFSNQENSQVDGHALFMDWEAGNWGFMGDVTLKSITSYRELDYTDYVDIDGTNMDLFHSGREIDYDQTSQELQMLGSTDNVNYVVGLYYFSENGDVVNPITFFGLFGSPTDNNMYGLDNDSYAIYSQLEWRPPSIEQLTVTAGVRYTDEEKDQYIDHPNSSTGGVGAFSEDNDDSWDNTSASLTLGWDFTDDIHTYAKFSQGWKSGGFNGEAPTAASFHDSYDPEEVDAYELGIKSRFFDNRLQINAAAFYNEIDDMQFSVFLEGSGGAASIVSNAGQATTQGVELEAVAQLTDSLSMSLNYGYLDSDYDEFIELGQDLKDVKDFPYAPENTASVSVDWAIGNWGWGDLDLHADWNYNDDYVPYTNPGQNATSQIDSYELINASLTLSEVEINSDMTMRFSLWGKNLADEEYRQNTIPFGFWTISYFGEPRTYGFDARLNF